jgi:ABC-type antimicrobial peptide transport system permease subunit
MLRQAFRDYDPRYIVTATTTMEERLARSIAVERFRAALSTVFGGTALVLAAIGLYGLAARRVADRRHELGVRVAMGARPRDLGALVLRDGVRTLAAGLAVGLPAALGASLVLRSFLFGVSATEPRVFLIAFLIIAVAALAAMLIPARRAGRVDVMESLRA